MFLNRLNIQTAFALNLQTSKASKLLAFVLNYLKQSFLNLELEFFTS